MTDFRATFFLLLALVGAGCQSAAGPSAASSSKVTLADSRDDEDVYTRQNLNDEDEAPPPNFAIRALDATGTRIGNFFMGIGGKISRTYRWFQGDRPGAAARDMENSDSADRRRQGINGLLEYDFTRHEPYTTRYRQIAEFDTEATVRATAIRASNRSRDAKARPLFVRALIDRSEMVRLEGAKALVHLPDPSAVAPLLKIADNREESRDVRIAAVDALKHYRTPAVARALVAALNERDFSIAWQARRSLRYLTGRDYRYDDGAWLAYFTGPDKPF